MGRKRGWLAALVLTTLGVTLWVLVMLNDSANPPATAARVHVREFVQALLGLAAPQPAAEPSKLPRGEIELCDYGRINSRPDAEFPTTVQADAALTLQRAVDYLIASESDNDRALGLKLRRIASASPIHDRALRQDPDCFGDAHCKARLTEATASASAADLELLVQLALTTREADSYAQAFHACYRGDTSTRAPACQQISTERWAQLDPTNAAPWFYAANEAHQRKDTAALDYAAYRISTSRKSDLRWGSDYAVMKSPAVAEQPRYTQTAVLTDLAGIHAAFAIPNYAPLTAFCARDQMADANRRQVCSDIGEVMTERDTTLIGFAIGIVIGERSGWPQERVLALREEKDALQAMDSTLVTDDPLLSCAWFEKFAAWTGELLQHGEMAAGRERIKRSGRSTAELAHQWRDDIKRREVEFKARETLLDEAKASLAPTKGN